MFESAGLQHAIITVCELPPSESKTTRDHGELVAAQSAPVSLKQHGVTVCKLTTTTTNLQREKGTKYILFTQTKVRNSDGIYPANQKR